MGGSRATRWKLDRVAAWRSLFGSLAVVGLLVALGLLPFPSPGAGAAGPAAALRPTAGPPLHVRVVANPAYLVLGNATNLTAVVSGGTAPFVFDWTALPVGCHPADLASLNCTPSEVGTFTVFVSVNDSSSPVRSGENSTQIVDNLTAGTTAAASPPIGEIYLFAGLLGVAAAVASTLVVLFARRRNRRNEPIVPVAESPYVPPPGDERR